MIENTFAAYSPRSSATTTDLITFAFQAGDWRLIGLDTLLPGAEEGYLSPDQLDWLSAELAAFVDMPTVIFLHHPPVPVYPGGEADLRSPGAVPRDSHRLSAGEGCLCGSCPLRIPRAASGILRSSPHRPQPFSTDPRKMTLSIYSHLGIVFAASRQIPTTPRSCACQRLAMRPQPVRALRLNHSSCLRRTRLQREAALFPACHVAFEIADVLITRRPQPELG